jgi:hypothetical protein
MTASVQDYEPFDEEPIVALSLRMRAGPGACLEWAL